MAVTTEDAADLGRCRRGIEPLRVVVMPQYDRQVASAGVEPMVPIDLSLLLPRTRRSCFASQQIRPDHQHRSAAPSDLFRNPPR